ncbi:MAG: outer membrane protein assembly factor BamA [Thermoanaerobaculales bacterium]|nr:outer membrane protein assembly factor BamA [Thermoanaerobaculales bacterium]
MKASAICVLLATLMVMPAGFAVGENEEGPIIAGISVEGGVTLTEDTVSYYLGLEEGDLLENDFLSQGFRRLWESGLVEDLEIATEILDDGRVNLIVVVQERPFISSVVFEGNKKLSATTLKDRLDEEGVELPRNTPLRLAQLSRIQNALEQIYSTDGYRSARVDYEIEDLGRNRRRVVYNIEEGGKVKIDEIDFVGNECFSDGRLRRSLKLIKEKKLYRIWGSKIIYSEESWQEDQQNLREFFLNHGYIDVKIGEPIVELVAKNPDAETLKKQKFRAKITIPVEEGEVYTLGSIEVRGAEIFPPEFIAGSIGAEEGKPYSYKVIDAGNERIRDSYHNRGYIYAYTNEIRQRRDDESKIVDVMVDVFEGDRFQLGRLEFSGNTSTKDKVLRREFRVLEGNWMNMGLFRSSVFKVNALGYWKLEEDPLEFDFDEEKNRVNVTVKGNEVGRNDLQFGAGYSELDGFFGQASFNTRNFLGRGDSLGVSIQIGGRADYYNLSFTEPFLFDRRILLGASIFSTSTDIADYHRESTGASLTLGVGLGMWGSLSGLFGYENVESAFAIQRPGLPGDETGGHGRPVNIPPIERQPMENALETFTGTTVSFTPAYRYDTRDDPFDTSRGTGINFRTRFAGGPLGGDFSYVRPEISFTRFISLGRKGKTILALNSEVGQFFVYDDSEIPTYERYRLGGDRTLRGLPYYSVRPRTEEGEYFYTEAGAVLGGDRYWLLNLEYQIRVGGPVKLVFFTDLGNPYHEDQGWDFGLYRQTYGVELRIFLPIFQAPIRFIYGNVVDPFPDEDSSDFQFSIGTTF